VRHQSPGFIATEPWERSQSALSSVFKAVSNLFRVPVNHAPGLVNAVAALAVLDWWQSEPVRAKVMYQKQVLLFETFHFWQQ
jgi:hypothetical protein